MSDKIIWLSILTHGIYEYSRTPYVGETGERIIFAKQDSPSPFKHRLYGPPQVTIPESVDFVQKITYTPFGLYNILSPNDKVKIYNKILSLIRDDIILGEPLTELIKNEVIFESLESKLSKPEQPAYILEDIRQLMLHRDEMCQEYIYNNNKYEESPKLINKSFSKIDVEEEEDASDADAEENDIFKGGIYVMRQEGGPLNVGDNILQDIEKITTQGLLNLMSEYGYNKIIIFDYSCDVCTTIFGIKPEDTHVEELKSQILEKRIGRGGKRTKRPRKMITRRQRKNIKKEKTYKYQK